MHASNVSSIPAVPEVLDDSPDNNPGPVPAKAPRAVVSKSPADASPEHPGRLEHWPPWTGHPEVASAEWAWLPLVYDELRRFAAFRVAREGPQQNLQATELVHEAWLRLAPPGAAGQLWNSRQHLFAALAEAMRWVLVDQARRRRSLRRGGAWERVDAEFGEVPGPTPDDQLLEVHEVLDRFAAQEPIKAELVKLRYFVGLTMEEAAEVMGVSEPTAKRYWAYARAWLFRELRKRPDRIDDADDPISR